MADVSVDGVHEPDAATPPDVVSLAAPWYVKAQERAARAGAPAQLIADVAELGKLTARIEALAEPDPADPYGADIDGRYERAAERLELSARLAQFMTRVAEEPEAVALWRQIADDQRQAAASARQAARIVGNARIE